jgi:hypothetical protein
MRHLAACICATLLTTLACTNAHAAVADSMGVGADFERVNRYLDIATDDTIRLRARGNFAGVQGHIQRGAALRVEGRVLLGSADYRAESGGGITENATLIEARATFGTAIQQSDRLYAGVATEAFLGNSPFDEKGDVRLTSVYVPFGWSSALAYAEGWRAIINLELRGYLVGRDSIDNIPGIGDETFHRRGGAGAAFSVRFQSTDAPVEIEPYLYWSDLARSASEQVNDTTARTENASRGGAGVRVKWLF